jgi:dihydroorotate dehydrogenase
MINEVRQVVNIPIIATGGCMSSEDAVIQALFAGASAIASSTFYYNNDGKSIRNFGEDLKKMHEMLLNYMKNNNINSLEEFYRK